MGTRKLGRRTLVRLLSYGLAALLVTAGFAVGGWMEAHKLRRYIESDYQRSFFEVVEGVNAINNALQKGRYAHSPTMLTALSGEVARRSAEAQSELAHLPFSFEELEDTAVFLSRVGDWSGSVARLAAAGQPLGEEQRKALDSLAGASQSLAAQLTDLESIINEENLRIGETIRAEESLEDAQSSLFAGTFKRLSEEFSELPALIYDGPFSDHIQRKEPAFLGDKPEISADEALARALAFIGLSPGQLTLSHQTEGRVPTYSFSGHLDGGEISISVTKRGGYVLNMTSSRTSGERLLTPEQAVEKAAAFLAERGYPDMQSNYYYDLGGVLLANFAYSQDDVTCYPDLIKLGVALDTGKIVSMESLGYILNHVPRRELAPAAVPAEDAWERSRSPDLTLEGSRLVVIPSPGQYELLCHELRCVTADGVHVMLYINAETGFEEQILILIEDENGTLTA